ncbi:trypsin-7-like [Culicoides brevitarsis]|uniref:trypsin-7-like n=1 Tax=Culicoides brevitarsis TaxID=469753 RepID=UPI00307B74E3
MKFFGIVFGLIAIAHGFPTNSTSRIHGGVETTIANHPYMIFMYIQNAGVGGASIISPEWALTNALNLVADPIPDFITFRAGSSDRTSGGLVVRGTEYHMHPEYKMWKAGYDVAVVKVSPSFEGMNIKPIPLTESRDELETGSLVRITGWGSTETGSQPIILRTVSVPIIDDEICREYWEDIWDDSMICAGEKGKDRCELDKGGPMVKDGVQYGVVSFYKTCGDGTPAIYAKLSNPAIRNFIRIQTGV